MSIEQRLEDLTRAINELPSALANVMNGVTAAVEHKTAEAPAKDQPVKGSGTTEESTESGSDNTEKAEATGEVAGRKTYVFDKTTKTGQIIEKGDALPVGDNFVRIGKTKWEQLCEKYNLDPATGEAAKEEESESDDLDDTEEEGEQEESSEDDDMGLGLDDEEDGDESVDPAEVKKRMVRVMREVGREDALKLFKKVGARNFDEVGEDKLPKLYELAGKVLGE